MKKVVIYILVFVVALAIGVGGSYLFFKDALKVKSKENNYETQAENRSESIDNKKYVNDNDVKNKLFPLLESTDKERVYQKNKVVVTDLNINNIILGVVKYIVLNNREEIVKKNNVYSLSIDKINQYAKKLYSREIDVGQIPEHVASIYSQTILLSYDNASKSYIFNLENYGANAILSNMFSNELEHDVIYDRVEVQGEYVYMYDKTILNNTIDWSNTGYGSISRFDGSKEQKFDENYEGKTTKEELFKKYPDYFTSYKHVFRINADDTYTYISSEPLV